TLWRLDLTKPNAWESLGDGPGLQGLAMVTHGGKLYRIGGFTAKNKEGEDADLWSQSDVSAYDPTTKKWTELAPLPEPRSSFDAAVLGNKIYVVGGWSMQGDGESKWHESACVLDLDQSQPKWQTLPAPPFQRRALSLAAHDEKIYVMGGMDHNGGISTRVDIYDPKTKSWGRGPNLQGEEMDGFGSSAFAVGGRLYASTYSGLLQRLSADGESWEVLKELDLDRFFHRLLPLASNELMAIGGASMSSGKFDELEVIRIK
ncbi:MAG: kelch repeat-containing protein, partial [Rubripirellula sp.]|nr:kelch repeat-containing protein [Rubripirellula sp.]